MIHIPLNITQLKTNLMLNYPVRTIIFERLGLIVYSRNRGFHFVIPFDILDVSIDIDSLI